MTAGLSVQQDLLVAARQHDLPPLWNGRVVVWTGWEATPQLFICTRGRGRAPKACCEGCGSTEQQPMNVGYLATHPTVTREEVQNVVAGTPPGVGLAYRHLTAFRCPECKTDVVVEVGGDVWTLDHTDYGDEGSS